MARAGAVVSDLPCLAHWLTTYLFKSHSHQPTALAVSVCSGPPAPETPGFLEWWNWEVDINKRELLVGWKGGRGLERGRKSGKDAPPLQDRGDQGAVDRGVVSQGGSAGGGNAEREEKTDSNQTR